MSEAKPVAWQVRRPIGKRLGRGGFYLIAALVVIAAEQDVGRRIFFAFIHDVGDGAANFERVLLLLEGVGLRRQRNIFLVVLRQPTGK